jgi:hypothetical protein
VTYALVFGAFVFVLMGAVFGWAAREDTNKYTRDVAFGLNLTLGLLGLWFAYVAGAVP